ncbi:hypothetical protein [Klebsiella quasipneumoniae]|uniref:hypothetical protein n=1 Tax=Klebsiella quasipneumoniae TaxID=1463165 RepID=UPI000E46D354|nr:hypothetical protein [Klebsiella quasipneumoniae]MBC4168720.1 hypothetical protein [Klebsiella quasipneumoniae]MBX8479366.1 hypothetical protein [Klebsiella quasipneumoniae subsp. similipneumoniae]MBX9411494.1 hypothetical protein [Klebsiella quasipneumoniae subsp. similipneumoniae]MBX9417717.1 hypothetical protein [Klebsiella quasipneumoniae subsp. similipneumoniae]HBT4704264.1 hypothetical protein [Klebsiella quasipneumoniae subsp. similipneumoniae]
MISRKELFAEISNEAVTEDGEVVGYFVKNSRMNLFEQMLCSTVTDEKLQESAYRAGLTAGWNLGLANNNDGFNKCLAAHAAGIKVEAE